MKTIILFALLAAASAARVCFPAEFTVDVATYDSPANDYYMSTVYFSTARQMERIDVFFIDEDGEEINEKITFILDFTNKKWYEADYYLDNNTAVCHIHDLTGNLGELCLSQNAELRSSFYLGGSFRVDNYAEYDQRDGDVVALDVSVATGINIPIRAYERDTNTGESSTTEYWNFKSSVHHDTFVIPQVCQSAAKELKRSVEPVFYDASLKASQVLRRMF